ncbi:ABC transporter permease [Cumulibacter manganitolerans]|uniref:ABC transporter permease n=1 Tax=Cumulibacter manganitolerans TaxID=1884992 RepID=UPI001294C23D|nr:ABC transporter permease [Cumulibacter manganitolerans]
MSTTHAAARPQHARITAATAHRILRQLAHDHRSIALIMVVPVVLLTLLYFMFEDSPVPSGQPGVFDNVGAVMLGYFPFFILFLITSITMLRERTSGTLERLLTTPIAKLDLLAGYAIAFALLALVQVSVMVAVAIWVFGLDVAGPLGLVYLVALADALLGVALGLFVSAFARTEFQAVQFVPALIVPQTLLCGLFIPRTQMAGWLDAISDYLPVTYAVQGMQEVARHSSATASLWNSVIVVVVVSVLCLGLGALTLRRRSA